MIRIFVDIVGEKKPLFIVHNLRLRLRELRFIEKIPQIFVIEKLGITNVFIPEKYKKKN